MIIQKMQNNKQIFVFLLFFLALFLRIYRIDALTEFLGDQGRTGVEIYQAVSTKTLPLLGPTVLSGQYLGPAFYYIIAPSFIVTGFNPLAPAIFTAFLGALVPVLIYSIGRKMFSEWIGAAIGILYAVSPAIVRQDRTLWEPTLVPLFIVLFIFALFNIREYKQYAYFPLAGAAVGILLQLHYPNLLLLPISGVFWLYIFLTQEKKRIAKHFLLWSLAGVATFFVVLLPFLFYEIPHKFENIRGVLSIFLLPSASPTPRPPFFPTVIEMSWRLFKNVFSLQLSPILNILQIVIVVFPFFVKRSFWHMFFVLWFFAGIMLISLYREAIFDHYLNFLLPLPFFFLGYFLYSIDKHVPKAALVVSLLVLILFSVSKLDLFNKGYNDIFRTEAMTSEMASQADGEPFSFTLTTSRSFSDLHYRYFFTIEHITPSPITSNNYSILFLICERDLTSCPKNEIQTQMQEVQALCYEPHCKWEYPTISLTNFSFVASKDILGGRLFTYQRNTRQ